MANAPPHRHDVPQPVEERELNYILNTLAFCRENLLESVNFIYSDIDQMFWRFWSTLKPAENLISHSDMIRITSCLFEAVHGVKRINVDIDERFAALERNARRSLTLAPCEEIYTRQQVQQMINEGRQRSLWRRVACGRTNVAKPPHDEHHSDHSRAAVDLLNCLISQWDAETRRLDPKFQAIRSLAEEVGHVLAPIALERGYDQDLSIYFVRSFIPFIRHFIKKIDDFMSSYRRTMNALISIRDSVAYERDN